jgi:hypothetical protein
MVQMNQAVTWVNSRKLVLELIRLYGHRAKEWILTNIPAGKYQAQALRDYTEYYWLAMGN